MKFAFSVVSRLYLVSEKAMYKERLKDHLPWGADSTFLDNGASGNRQPGCQLLAALKKHLPDRS